MPKKMTWDEIIADVKRVSDKPYDEPDFALSSEGQITVNRKSLKIVKRDVFTQFLPSECSPEIWAAIEDLRMSLEF